MKMGYTRTSCLFVCCFVWLFVVLFVCLFVWLFDFCHKNDLNYKLNILGPLCLWQCLLLGPINLDLRYFVAKSVFLIYAFFSVNFILQKFCPCKRNDKYEVWHKDATSIQGNTNCWIMGMAFRGSGDRERNWGRKNFKKGPVDHTIAKTTFVHRLVKNHSPLSEKLHQKV